jgi:UDP:flavonoid glycosyltransferase YjiC (YdhE family)
VSPSSPPERRRLLLGAFGDPGHAFPMIALGRELASRGHAVTLETWRRWEADVRGCGMAFAAAPETPLFPTAEYPMDPYAAAVPLTWRTLPLVEELRPDAVVADVLTLAPALAAELAGVRHATLIPHVHPAMGPGLPPYSSGVRRPRTALGRALWRLPAPAVRRGLLLGRDQLNAARAQVGLPAVRRLWGGMSSELCLVGTFPQLEYPRAWPARTRVVGPLLWEPPSEGDVQPPPGDGPVVLVAPSTSQDPSQRLLRSALEGLADVPVRVLAATNRQGVGAVPANARAVDWLSYARTMPRCDVVVCHGGHGTVARALASGCAVVVVPAGGDMSENAARVDWAGVGVRVPRRLCTPFAVRLAVGRALAVGRLRRRARELADWAAANDGASRAADAVERWGAARKSAGLPGPGSGCPGNLAR